MTKREEIQKRRKFAEASQGNWLDRVISGVSPQRGMQRMQARISMGVMSSYKGASYKRPNDGWKTSSGSPVSDTIFDLAIMRDRARDLVRNSPYAFKGLGVLERNVVGVGIEARLKPGADSQAKRFFEAWNTWKENCDYDGLTNLSGLQARAFRSAMEGGDALIRVYAAPQRYANDIPLRIQVIEGDYLDELKNVNEITSGINAGGRIVQGVEFDKFNNRVAYWLFDRHPGDFVARGPSQRIDAFTVLPLFRPLRAGQVRGITAFAPVIMKMKDLGDYEEAELVAKKLQACFAAWIKSQSAGPTEYAKSAETNNDTAVPIGKMEPGMMYLMKPGDDVVFGKPPISGEYSAYVTQHLHAIAAGLEMPYELLSGDLSRVNYSSIRCGLLEFRNLLEQLRWHMMIPMFCERVWRRAALYASIVGLASGDEQAAWVPPQYESIDPIKDTTADLMRVRAGFTSLPQLIAERGDDFLDTLLEIQEANRLLDSMHIILDSDPRKQTQRGMAQVTNETTDSSPQKGGN